MAKRRGIFERLLKDGRVAYDVKYRDQFGQQHMKTLYRVREAEAFRDSVKTDIRAGTYIPPKNITVEEAASKWLKLREDSVRETTLTTYNAAVKWITGYFSLTGEEKAHTRSLLLRNVTLENCKEFVSYLQREGLAAGTIDKIVTVLKSIFQEAVDHDNLAKNPTRLLKKPKAPRKRKWVPTPEQMGEIIKKIEPFYRMLFKTLPITGLRISECIALKWPDVDFNQGWIVVDESVQNGEFKGTKTDSSTAVVFVPDWLLEELKLHRVQQSLELEENVLNLVFTNKDGGVINRYNLYHRVWVPVLKELGLPICGFHTARRYYASRLVASGINLNTVKEQMRHSDIKMTDEYTYLLPSNIRKDINEKLSPFPK